jgi:2-hydroxy-3-keto-5-methylthiopentenyl-1-phosphate phosphatase
VAQVVDCHLTSMKLWVQTLYHQKKKKKKAGMVMLISDKVDYKRDKEHFMVIKESRTCNSCKYTCI